MWLKRSPTPRLRENPDFHAKRSKLSDERVSIAVAATRAGVSGRASNVCWLRPGCSRSIRVAVAYGSHRCSPRAAEHESWMFMESLRNRHGVAHLHPVLRSPAAAARREVK